MVFTEARSNEALPFSVTKEMAKRQNRYNYTIKKPTQATTITQKETQKNHFWRKKAINVTKPACNKYMESARKFRGSVTICPSFYALITRYLLDTNVFLSTNGNVGTCYSTKNNISQKRYINCSNSLWFETSLLLQSVKKCKASVKFYTFLHFTKSHKILIIKTLTFWHGLCNIYGIRK